MSGLLWQAFNLFKEVMVRLFQFPDFILALFGIKPIKKLRLRVVILRDEYGTPVASNEDLLPLYEETRRILVRSARVLTEPSGWRVVTAPVAAPRSALDVHCTDGAWQDDLGEPGKFFRSLMAKTGIGTVFGYGAPVTVFIVRSISSHNGCSLGSLTDYVTLEAKALKMTRRLMAHEIGHACGLFHSSAEGNLMVPKSPGENLSHLQAAVFRSSRHITYF